MRQRKKLKAAEDEAAVSKAKKAAYRRADSALTVDRPFSKSRSASIISSFFQSPSHVWKGGILVEDEKGVAPTSYAEVGRIALVFAVGVSVGIAMTTRSSGVRSYM